MVVVAASGVFLVLAVGLVVIPAAPPAARLRTPHLLRAVLAVRPVSALESISNQLRANIDRIRFGNHLGNTEIS